MCVSIRFCPMAFSFGSLDAQGQQILTEKRKANTFSPKKNRNHDDAATIPPQFRLRLFPRCSFLSPCGIFLRPKLSSFISSPLFPRRRYPKPNLCSGEREKGKEREWRLLTTNYLPPLSLSLSFSLGRDREEGKKRKEKERLTAGAPRGDALWMEKRGKGYGEKEIR